MIGIVIAGIVTGEIVNLCQPPALPLLPTTPIREDMAAAIPLRVAGDLHALGDTLFVDAGPSHRFVDSHILGARSVPGGSPLPSFSASDLERRIVVYCAMPGCSLKRLVARQLRDRGGKRVFVLREGIGDWKAVGFPTACGSERINL